MARCGLVKVNQTRCIRFVYPVLPVHAPLWQRNNNFLFSSSDVLFSVPAAGTNRPEALLSRSSLQVVGGRIAEQPIGKDMRGTNSVSEIHSTGVHRERIEAQFHCSGKSLFYTSFCSSRYCACTNVRASSPICENIGEISPHNWRTPWSFASQNWREFTIVQLIVILTHFGR